MTLENVAVSRYEAEDWPSARSAVAKTTKKQAPISIRQGFARIYALSHVHPSKIVLFTLLSLDV